MIDEGHVLIYGGRSTENEVLNDLCVLDIQKMEWVNRQICGFPRCSHTMVYLAHSATDADGDDMGEEGGAGRLHPSVSDEVLVFGGWSGTEVTGDVLSVDTKTLQVRMRLPGPSPQQIAAYEAAQQQKQQQAQAQAEGAANANVNAAETNNDGATPEPGARGSIAPSDAQPMYVAPGSPTPPSFFLSVHCFDCIYTHVYMYIYIHTQA